MSNEKEKEQTVNVDTAGSGSQAASVGDNQQNLSKIEEYVNAVGNAYADDLGIDQIVYATARNPIELYGQMCDNASGAGTLFFMPLSKEEVLIAVGTDPNLDYPRDEANFYNIHYNTENIDSLTIQRYDVGKSGMNLEDFGEWFNEFVDEHDIGE